MQGFDIVFRGKIRMAIIALNNEILDSHLKYNIHDGLIRQSIYHKTVVHSNCFMLWAYDLNLNGIHRRSFEVFVELYVKD